MCSEWKRDYLRGAVDGFEAALAWVPVERMGDESRAVLMRRWWTLKDAVDAFAEPEVG